MLADAAETPGPLIRDSSLIYMQNLEELHMLAGNSSHTLLGPPAYDTSQLAGSKQLPFGKMPGRAGLRSRCSWQMQARKRACMWA